MSDDKDRELDDLEYSEVFRAQVQSEPSIASVSQFWMSCYNRALARCIGLHETDEEAVNRAARIAWLSVKKVYGKLS